MNKKLADLLKAAAQHFDSLSPEEQEAHRKEQQASWVRGEMAMGNDRDEARWRARAAKGNRDDD